jgi:heme A synthase
VDGPYDITWTEWFIFAGGGAVSTFIGLMIYFWIERRRNERDKD